MLTRRAALAALARGRRHAPPTPQRLHATAVKPTAISLAWKPVAARRVVYEVFRDGRRLASSPHPRFDDHSARPKQTYRYSVAARVDRADSARSRPLTVRTPPPPPPARPAPARPAPARPSPVSRDPVVTLPQTPSPPPAPPTPSSPPPGPPPAPPTPSSPPPGPPPAPPDWPDPILTTGMVDRLMWRAGFGPTDADRQQWTGQPASTLIDHFLTTPYDLAPTSTPPTYRGNPIDPLASSAELQMEWLDRMQRTTNPFTERMNFFWHRHFAVSHDSDIPASMLLAYRDRLRRYSDFAANPSASFRDLALEMTTQDAAMSVYLTGFLNRKGSPNENYAREFMELFTLGPTDAAGNPNYSQSDVHQLARAFTGYTLNRSTGVVSLSPTRVDTDSKTILGHTGSFNAAAAVDLVLSQPNHGPFLISKLWSEFIAAPIPADALRPLVAGYVYYGLQLAPVVRAILRHPLMFDSLGEPTMIKPPVLYTVAVLRALGAPLRDSIQTNALANMQQQPYHPPNVSGWEGGLSWMTTTTSVARFSLITSCQKLLPPPADVPEESAQAAFDRAYATCGSPWIAPGTRTALLSYASQAPALTAAQRAERFYVLCELILGGPDAQVM